MATEYWGDPKELDDRYYRSYEDYEDFVPCTWSKSWVFSAKLSDGRKVYFQTVHTQTSEAGIGEIIDDEEYVFRTLQGSLATKAPIIKKRGVYKKRTGTQIWN